jgi:outer membrane protein OmpU
MKKILLATSILAGTAGLAAAEVSLSGSARMGVIQDFGDGDVGFTSRARVVFTMSGESDSGFSFGASFRADNASDANNGEAGSVFISSDYGTLSMGDVDGAALSAVGHIDGVGLTGLGDLNESIFIANGGLEDDADGTFGVIAAVLTDDPTALYEYSTGGFSFYMSSTNPSYGTATGVIADGGAYALGMKYAVDAYSFGLGWENLDVEGLTAGDQIEADHLIASAAATFGGFTMKATYGEADGDTSLGGVAGTLDLTQWGVSGTYAVDALSVTAFYNNKDLTSSGAGAEIDLDAYGLGAAYDLGGGASVVGGVVTADANGPEGSDTAWDFGVNFAF